ncbi:MAG: 1-acyl-sn-glycerol-3-phosphate acyltransferase, partial [Pseudomonadota bacterium]
MNSVRRNNVQDQVVARLVNAYLREAQNAPEGYLETLINDTLYHERRRLEKEEPRKTNLEIDFYDRIRRRLRHASEKDLSVLLEKLARRFVTEIVGKFDERVYRLATKVAPATLWGLLNAMSPRRLFSLEGMQRGLADHLRIEGEIEHVKALLKRGTLVIVPTHTSNMDSILQGYAAYLIGMPPLTFGAGTDLFSNPLLSFFMRNLGAYKVDRKKTAVLYKDVLKECATVCLKLKTSPCPKKKLEVCMRKMMLLLVIFVVMGAFCYPTQAAEGHKTAFKAEVQKIKPFSYVCYECQGPYAQFLEKEKAFLAEFNKSGIKASGPELSLYWNSPLFVKPEELLWDIGYPVSDKTKEKGSLKV